MSNSDPPPSSGEKKAAPEDCCWCSTWAISEALTSAEDAAARAAVAGFAGAGDARDVGKSESERQTRVRMELCITEVVRRFFRFHLQDQSSESEYRCLRGLARQ